MYNVLFLLMVLLISCNPISPINGINNEENVVDLSITIDPTISRSPVKNIFSDINMWDYRTYWTTQAEAMPDDFFQTKYPFVERVQFMTATGGNASRDLFINPADATILDDYNFTPLISALRNVVDKGLKPMIKTGAVPEKFSYRPTSAAFGVNVRPPYDYDIYYNYIKALSEALVTEFGIDEIKTWSWGVLTEYENADWFEAEVKSATKEAFCKLYDYTVAALQDVIGKENLIIGAHSMTCDQGLWDEEDFIEHCATGKNYKTGEIGTQLNYLAASFYDLTPGRPVEGNLSLTNTINLLKEKASSSGLIDLKFGVDEGRILNGLDGKALSSRVVAHTFQASSDAAMFKLMNELNADWFSTWCLNTEDVWGKVDLVSTHVANLCYKMTGHNQIDFIVEGKSSTVSNNVDGMAVYDSSNNRLFVMVYNYNPDIMSTSAESPVITIKNVRSSDEKANITEWIIDDNHGNFWPTWEEDMKAKDITSDSFGWSFYSTNIPQQLQSQSDLEYWRLREDEYSILAKIDPKSYVIALSENTITLSPTLQHHGVSFYQIDNIQIVK